MLTPDDETRQGETRPECFPARDTVISFCRYLRRQRNAEHASDVLNVLHGLPIVTDGSYFVNLHRARPYFTRQNRQQYFSGLPAEGRHVFFLDPDIGFEPETRSDKKHVLYSDINAILEQISEESVLSVFQHFRFLKFDRDFARIRNSLNSAHVAGVYWYSLMFVAIGKNREIIEKVIAVNHQYSRRYPVTCLSETKHLSANWEPI